MKENTFHIVYGIHPINEVIRAKKRKIYEIYTRTDKSKQIELILSKIPSYTKVIFCDKKRLDYIAGSADHQSIVAFVSPFIYQKINFVKSEYPAILCCDSIQDTKNLGALLRSAYCTNFSGVIIQEFGGTEITASVMKSSAGLAEHIPILKTKNIIDTIRQAKDNGYNILLADANGKSIDKYFLEAPIMLVIGNEHQGINKKLLSYGSIISLAQKESIISYNASVAGGILMYNISFALKLI